MAFWDKRSLDDYGVKEFLKEYLDSDHIIEGSAGGIARQFIDPKARPLTPIQERRLKEGIEEIAIDECVECMRPLSWEEMFEATSYDRDGLCRECRDNQDILGNMGRDNL